LFPLIILLVFQQKYLLIDVILCLKDNHTVILIKVDIVGGSISGLTAAASLKQYNKSINVVVHEKYKEIGYNHEGRRCGEAHSIENIWKRWVPEKASNVEDFYEEIARLHGYDSVDACVPKAPLTGTRNTDHDKRVQLRRLCAGLGLTETVNWSLVSSQDLALVRFPAKEAVGLSNPLSQDHAWLRPTLLVGLLNTVRHNLSRGAAGVRIFEIGGIAEKSGSGSQRLALGIAVSGLWAQDWRGAQPADFFHLKGLLDSLGRRLGTAFRMERHDARWAQAGEAVQIFLASAAIGEAGTLDPLIGESLDLEQPVWCAQILVEPVLGAQARKAAIQAPAAYPPVKRDLSLVLENAVAFEAVEQAIRKTAQALGYRIQLIDRYTGKPVPSGKHSLTFSIEYRDVSRTLTAQEADQIHKRVGEVLTRQFGAAIR